MTDYSFKFHGRARLFTIGPVMARVIAYLGNRNVQGRDCSTNIRMVLTVEGYRSDSVYEAIRNMESYGLVEVDRWGEKQGICKGDPELTELGWAAVPLCNLLAKQIEGTKQQKSEVKHEVEAKDSSRLRRHSSGCTNDTPGG